MALNPTLKINVDDTDFANFVKQFSAFQNQLHTANNTVLNFGAKNWNLFGATLQGFASPLKTIVKLTGSIAHNIVNATKALIRFTGIASLVGGVLGAGSLFGIRGLAESASQQRMTALGIGAPTGQINAFQASYSRYLNDPTGLMGRVAEAQNDPAKLAQMGYAYGIRNAGQMSVYDLSKAIVAATPDMLRRYGNNPEIYRALGGENFLSYQEARRLQNVAPAELAGAGREADNNVRRLGLSDPDERAWQDFMVKLTMAGTTIENTFIRGLTSLAGPLGKLSDAFSNLVAHILGNPEIGHWIDNLAVGLNHFATAVSDGHFQENVDHFITQIGTWGDRLGDAIGGLNGFIEVLRTIWGWMQYLNPYRWGQVAGNVVGAGIGAAEALTDEAINRLRALGPSSSAIVPGLLTGPPAGAQTFADVHSIMDQADRQAGLPVGVTWANYGVESGFGTNSDMLTPHDHGVVGPLQQKPEFMAQYGLTGHMDQTNIMDQMIAETNFMRKFMLLHADRADVIDEARAAYHMGANTGSDYARNPGGFDALYNQFGAQWRQHLAPDVRVALDRYDAIRGGQAGPNAAQVSPVQVQITVSNRTGNQVDTTVNQNRAPGAGVAIPQ